MKTTISLCFFLLVAGLSGTRVSGQIINTCAGIGPVSHAGSYSGDGGPAVLAGISRPLTIALDTPGNVYFVDAQNVRIRKVSTTGIITTIAGNGVPAITGDGGPASAAEIGDPYGIATDKFGNIYISDISDTVTIRKINAAGIITTIAGAGGTGYTGDGGPATAALLNTPEFLATDDSGNLYVSESSGVRKINTAGIITTVAGIPGVDGYSGDGGPATAAQFNFVHGIKVDKKGNLYIMDENNYRVRKVDTAGIVTTIAGTGTMGYTGDGGPATAAQIGECFGLGIDTFGNLYIPGSTVEQNIVRKIDTAGIITTIAGNGTEGYSGDGGPPTAAEMASPSDVAVAPSGIIYIADDFGNRIRVISYNLYFNAGRYQAATACAGYALRLDTLLAADDSNAGVTENWMPLSGPYHGTAVTTYSATTTGNTVYPTGLSYTPTPGYTGYDTLVERITNGAVSDTTTIYFNVILPPVLGAITGPDSVCISDEGSITLTDTTAGGAWSATNATATVASGTVRGSSAGTDTILYVVSNICGMDTATHVITVKACDTADTIAGVSAVNPAAGGLRIYPNPAAANGAVSVLLSSAWDEAVRIEVSDMLGEQVAGVNAITNHAAALRLPAAGVYFVTAVTAHGAWTGNVAVE